MYYRDLDVIEDRTGPVQAVGWLAKPHPFSIGEPSSDLILALLWSARALHVNQMRGFHYCEFCNAEEVRVRVPGEDRPLLLGSAEILVRALGGPGYLAPNLIVHYVDQHKYLPPAEFQAALLSSWRQDGQSP